jgi:hypothetical protein
MYELYCLDPEVLETYVGSSRYIEHIMSYHKICSGDYYQPLYEFIDGHGGWSHWSVRLSVNSIGSLNSLWVDYEFPTIYKIFCLDPLVTEVYVGKTNNFCYRQFMHYMSCDVLGDSKKVYKFIREHGGWSNWKMVRVEVYPHATEFELDRLEFIWWKRLGGELNMRVPGFKKFLYLGDDEEFCQSVLSNGCRKSFTKDEIFLDI